MSISRSIVRPLQKSVSRSVVQGAVTDPLQELIQQLFGNGEQGAFGVVDTKYLWQDTAKTVPVTADGDPVRVMEDISGNGNDFVAPSDALRPIYRQGGKLEFSGVDAYMEFDGPDLTSGMSLYSALSGVDVTGQHGVVSSASDFRNGSLYLRPSGSAGLAVGSFGDGLIMTSTASPSMVLGATAERNGSVTVYKDSLVVGSSTAGTQAVLPETWWLGRAPGISTPTVLQGGIHGVLVVDKSIYSDGINTYLESLIIP